MKRPQSGARWLAPLCLVIAFQFHAQQIATAHQQSESPHSGAAGSVGAEHGGGGGGQPTGPMLSMGSESSSALESSAAMAGDDLIAAESSQSSADNAASEPKSFTSGQMLRQEAASVAPMFSQPPPQQQQQQPQPLQQQQQVPPHVVQQQQQQPQPMYGAQHMIQQRIPNGPPKAFNSFMAAALAGNYGPAQQQIAAAAAASLQAQSRQQQHAGPMPHPAHPPMMGPPQQQHPQQQHAQQHHQLVGHPQPQHQHQSQPQMVAPQQQQQQQQMPAAAPLQRIPQPVEAAPGMAVQESSVRNNIVPAPGYPNPTMLDSNTIDEPGSGARQEPAPMASSASHAVMAPAGSGLQEAAGAWPLQPPDIPKIVNLEVKCEKNLMKVSIEFDKVFNGVIFSKGHYNQGQCLHVGQNSAKHQAYFDISINSCGTQGNTQNGLYGMGGNTGSGTYFENTIVVQYDPNVQEVYDHARKLRCTWHDQYEKAVTFRPFPVDMLDIVRADFAGDNVGCWMQIQVGKGPWASEVAGIVKIGQTMTMVLAIKDEENKFDMLVRNCFAHDGKRGPIELVDKSGCITRPKLMSRFTKIKNFGSAATVLSYAHFQAFKFPDSMEVHFQCTIQICRHQCPEQCSSGSQPGSLLGGASGAGPGEAYSESTISGTFNIHGASQAVAGGGSADSVHLRKYGSASSASLSRERRDLSHHHQHPRHSSQWLAANGSHPMFMGSSRHNPEGFNLKPMSQTVGLNRIIQVVSTGDLAFAVQTQQQAQQVNGSFAGDEPANLAEAQASQLTRLDLSQQICMSSYNFVLSLVVLALILLCSSCAAIGLYLRHRSLANRSNNGKLLLPTASSLAAACSSPTLSSSSTSASSTLRHHNNVPTRNQLYPTQQQHHHMMFEGPSH